MACTPFMVWIVPTLVSVIFRRKRARVRKSEKGTVTFSLCDHDELCRDRLLAVLCDRDDLTGEFRRLEADRGKPLAGKSTLTRLELTPLEGPEPEYKKISAQVRVTKRKVWLSFSESYPYAAWLRTVLARVQTHPLRCYHEPAGGKKPSWKSAGRTLRWSRLLGENHRSRVPARSQMPLDIAGFRFSSPHSSRQDSS